MVELLEKIKNTARLQSLWDSSDRLLVAFSGGMDSTVLLHVLAQAEQGATSKLGAAHFDHCLRPESSDEAKHCRKFAWSLGIPFYTKQAQGQPTGNMEAWARKERYRFLEEMAQSHGYQRILTAHHADDQAETLLFQLVRGSGPDGWCGIAFKKDNIVRPLLAVTKKEIRSYAKSNDLSWVDDPSNLNTDFSRNSLRHNVLPLLEEINPKAAEHLAGASARAAELNIWLEEEARKRLDQITNVDNTRYDLDAFRSLPAALRIAILRHILPRGDRDIPEARWREADRFLNGKTGKNTFYWMDCVLIVQGSRLEIKPVPQTASPPTVSLEINGNDFKSQSIPWSGGVIHVTVLNVKEIHDRPWLSKGVDQAWFDADQLPDMLQLRQRQNGDRISLPNVGTRLVSDVLIDAKIPEITRNSLPILASTDTVFWIAGVRRCSLALVNDETKKVLKLIWERNG